MNEIVKCSCCHKILTRKQFHSHECEVPCKGTKKIPILYYVNFDKIGEPEILGVGLDGVNYYLVVKKPVAIPFIRERLSSDENLQGNKSDKDFTECCATKFIY